MNKLKEKLSSITDEELDTLSTRELLTYKVLCRFAIRNDELKKRINKAIKYINEAINYPRGWGLEPLDEIYAKNIIDRLESDSNE